MAVEADIHKHTEKAKTDKAARAAADRVLAKWLDDTGTAKGRFRDPMKG